MARLARVVVAGLPHHVVQRGNRRQKVFSDDDRVRYLEFVARLEERLDRPLRRRPPGRRRKGECPRNPRNRDPLLVACEVDVED